MLTIKYQTAFKKDYKRIRKRGYDISQLEMVICMLAEGQELPPKYANCRECHIAPDWLLVYEVKEKELLLYLIRTGTHSDIF